MKKSLGAKTLTYPTPVWLVGTYDSDGKPNIMTASWGGICCSQPPCIAVSLQKPRHSYAAMMEHKSFTISVPSEKHMREADYAGMVSGKKIDKFSVTGFTAMRSRLVDAPYVEQAPVVLECKLLQAIDLGMHTQFIGEIVDVKAEESILNGDGAPDIEKIKPLIFDPGQRAYYGIGAFLGKGFAVGHELAK